MIVLPGVQVPAIIYRHQYFNWDGTWHISFSAGAELWLQLLHNQCWATSVLLHTSRDTQRQLTSLTTIYKLACTQYAGHSRIVVTMILCTEVCSTTDQVLSSSRLRVEAQSEIYFVTFNSRHSLQACTFSVLTRHSLYTHTLSLPDILAILPLTHTHILTHSLTYFLTHSLTHSLTRSHSTLSHILTHLLSWDSLSFSSQWIALTDQAMDLEDIEMNAASKER